MSSAEPGWVHDVIWWHAYPLGFVGAERSPSPDQPVVHRLGHLEAWLDHAVELGASGLALGPIFASETHGYDTVDHFRVDPRLGDEPDLDSLLTACRGRGLHVMLDGVFNHVGRSHPAFQAVLDKGPAAPSATWFRLRWPRGPASWHEGVEPDYDDFEGHSHLVALNPTSEAVTEYVVEVMTHWLDRGVDAWRLDAAYALPLSFWAQVVDQVRSRHPDAYVMGEVIHGDYVAFVREGHLDAVTQYELWKAIWSSLNDANFFELAAALSRHDGFLDDMAPYTFVGNHDVTRIASRLLDDRHLAHAVVILMTVGGTPAIYAGDEHGFRGVKEDRPGGDDAVRPEFPATPADLSALGRLTYDLHRELIGVRRRNRWLHRASTEVVHLANEHIVYETAAEGERLLVALSVADRAADLPAPGAGQLLAGSGEVRAGRLVLPPHGWAVLAPVSPSA